MVHGSVCSYLCVLGVLRGSSGSGNPASQSGVSPAPYFAAYIGFNLPVSTF